MAIVYRYFQSHWYETLRDAEFLASSPVKFNDILDCSACGIGDIPEEEIYRYFHRRDWFGVFAKACEGEGKPIDMAIDALNSERFTIENLDLNRRLRTNLENRKSLSKVWRIVCFSEPPLDSLERRLNESRMWKRYANKDRGVRIGVDFSLCTTEPEEYILHKVYYSQCEGFVDFRNIKLNPLRIHDLLVPVFTKVKRIWGRECEVRLLTKPDFCNVKIGSSGTQLCFWKFNREMVRQVFLGARFPHNQIKGLIKMLKRVYPKELEVYHTKCPGRINGYEYDRIA